MHAVNPADSAALAEVVVEIERHVNGSGWDQPAQLFALVPTADLLASAPHLAAELETSQPLTPVAQGGLPAGAEDDLADALARIEWPDAVAGCAVAVERVVVPTSAESETDLARAVADPRRHEVRMVAGVLRDGGRYGAVRLRAHDEDAAVLTGADLVPTLCEVLAWTFAPSSDGDEADVAAAHKRSPAVGSSDEEREP